MSGERLQKILARAGVASRRKVEDLIREGRVTVNGEVATLGQQADLERDAVKVDGKRIQPPPSQHRYVLIHKPSGCICSTSDPEGRPTVLDLLPPRLRGSLLPVGRLDYDSEGALLLTDDGELAHRVAHPSYGCVKTYEVKVRGEPKESSLDRLRGGIVLDGKRTSPALVEPMIRSRGPRDLAANSWWRVGLGEGRTRQIREMFRRIGHPVQRLRRIAVGPLGLSGLPRGTWRELDAEEVEELRRRTAKRVGKTELVAPSRSSVKRRATAPAEPSSSGDRRRGGGRRGAGPRGAGPRGADRAEGKGPARKGPSGPRGAGPRGERRGEEPRHSGGRSSEGRRGGGGRGKGGERPSGRGGGRPSGRGGGPSGRGGGRPPGRGGGRPSNRGGGRGRR